MEMIMNFAPIDKMWEQIEIARDDSDMSLFMNLMYMGEMLTKIIVAGMISAIDDDKQRNRYTLIYRLVRADGLGEWSTILDEILTGPAAQFLTPASLVFSRELTDGVKKGNWQYDAIEHLRNCLKFFGGTDEPITTKIAGRKWFSDFARLRNKTRGHGAPKGGKCTQICEDLELSIKLIVDNFSMFDFPWAYLHRNFSGKYRVSRISSNVGSFDFLKRSATSVMPQLDDGVYIYFSDIRFVELISSDPDLFDFHFPNGQFSEKKFEFFSYITDTKIEGDSLNYLDPVIDLPESETNGSETLLPEGNTFSNLPPIQDGYIPRNELEESLKKALLSDNHPIVTLRGTGGIGKTWLALKVVHAIADMNQYNAIFWFSARDIDLLTEGPKKVKPRILDEHDVAEVFVDLMNPSERNDRDFKPIEYLAKNLKKSSLGPVLYIFDNFETVKNPGEFYFWLDTYLRLPNKVLITTKVREFKADYDVLVSGMNDDEAENLINQTSEKYLISRILTRDYKRQLIDESEGHPYVIKILLGEVAKAGKLVNIERLVANRDEILKALFERTFNNLSPAAKRVFLTLCSWHTLIPQIALEAVLLRPENERVDVIDAIDELEKSSFIEVQSSKSDNQIFLSVPMATYIFGKKKLAVSPMKSAIEADSNLLKALGTTNNSEISFGLAPRVRRLFQYVADKINNNPASLYSYLPILESVARSYPPAWLSIANLYEETSIIENRLEKSKQALQSFIESSKSKNQQREGWLKLSILCRRLGDWLGEIQALVEIAQLPETEFVEISNSANRLNSLLSDRLELESEEKRILGLKLLEIMDVKVKIQGNGTDYSRMAWLARNIGMHEKAKEYIESGLKVDPENPHIQSLASKLGII